MLDDLKTSALDYHRLPRPGKIEIAPTKPLATQRDLALAYSPGVAFACEAIKESPAEARNLTARGNLVGVVTNGTAVLGLGNIGPLAAKPVMEGKGVLFKKFAGIGDDRLAGGGDAGRVGQREVALVGEALGRHHRDLSRRRPLVVFEGGSGEVFLFGRHGHPPAFIFGKSRMIGRPC